MASFLGEALDGARHALLEALVAEHLKLHGGDPERSLPIVWFGYTSAGQTGKGRRVEGPTWTERSAQPRLRAPLTTD